MAAANPNLISIAADALRRGLATRERIERFLKDPEGAQLAATLAETRGPDLLKGTPSDDSKAVLVRIAAAALSTHLTDPDTLRSSYFANVEGAEEMIALAVGLAKKRLRAGIGYRPTEPWEVEPDERRSATLIERDPFTGAAMGPLVERGRPAVDPLELEARRQMAVAACGQGRHRYGEPDPFTGWSRCEACGYTLVADRRTTGPIYPQPAISYG